MAGEIIVTAGQVVPEMAQPKSRKREAIQAVRTILRNPQATDDDVDDALEALTELARTED